jgi:hypothetical protein
MTSEGCEEGSSHPYALVPAGKRRDVRVKYDPVLIGFPDSVHSHKGVVVLTSVGYDRSRRWRRRLVIWTCEAIPVRRHRRMIALHIYTLASDYVVTELWPWEIVAEADSCEKVNDMVVSQCSASAANGSTFAVGCTIRAISHGIQRLSFAIVVQKDITAAWYEKVSHTIRVARVQIMRVASHSWSIATMSLVRPTPQVLIGSIESSLPPARASPAAKLVSASAASKTKTFFNPSIFQVPQNCRDLWFRIFLSKSP